MSEESFLLDDFGNIFSTEDGAFIQFTPAQFEVVKSIVQLTENPHSLEKKIHAVRAWNNVSAELIEDEVGALVANFPITNASGGVISQNLHAVEKLVKELNRKLDHFGLSSRIRGSTDAGFLPKDINEFIREVGTIGTADFLELEDGNLILLENGSSIILEQDD